MELINNDVRRFLLINTVDYNMDGRYLVRDVAYNELGDYGLSKEEIARIDTFAVGVIETFDFCGFYVMRVA